MNLPPGYSFTIADETKRSDGEWHSRFTWLLRNAKNEYDVESVWWGFDTIQDAINDLSNYLEKNYK